MFRAITFRYRFFAGETFRLGISIVKAGTVTGNIGMIVVDTEIEDAHLGFSHLAPLHALVYVPYR